MDQEKNREDIECLNSKIEMLQLKLDFMEEQQHRLLFPILSLESLLDK